MPGPKEGGRGFTSTLDISPWGKREGANHFENSTLTFTKKTDRHFSIIYRAEGRGSRGEIALNYSSL